VTSQDRATPQVARGAEKAGDNNNAVAQAATAESATTAPAAPHPKAAVTPPTVTGPSSCPRLLPCMIRPTATGTSAASRATSGAEASSVAGITPPTAEKSRHSKKVGN